MKKIIIILLIIFLCGCTKERLAPDIVKDYLNSYQKLDKTVIDEINKVVEENSEFSLEQKNIYKQIFKNQYSSLKYEIISEDYTDTIANIKVSINVYDLNKAEEEALLYLKDHLKEFYDEENKFDNNKYLSYKLNLMKDYKYRVDYIINFSLTKDENNNWVLLEPTEDDLEKIHGIYKE